MKVADMAASGVKLYMFELEPDPEGGEAPVEPQT